MFRQKILILFAAGILLIPFLEVKADNSVLSPNVFVSSDSLSQGGTLLVRVKNESNQATGSLGTVKLRFFRNENGQDWVALIGIPIDKKPGSYKLAVSVSGKQIFEKNILVVEKIFPVTPLVVTKALSKKGYTFKNIAVNQDNKILNKIFGKITPEAYINQPFVFPLTEISYVGAFGNIRQAQGYQMQHLGVDLKASINTPIYSVNSGKVVFAGILHNCGKTIIIDHGLGVYSLYAHLGYMDVKTGQVLRQKEIIGLSGNTGYSLAPHLHFSIKVRTVSLDPLEFIRISQAQW